MKRIINIILPAILVISLAACGAGSPAQSTSTVPIPQTTTTTASVTTAATTAAETQPTTTTSITATTQTSPATESEPEPVTETVTEPEPETAFQLWRMGETVITEFAEMTLTGAEISEEATVQTQDGYTSTLYGSNIPGSKVVSLIFKIKSLHTDPITLNYMQQFAGKASVGKYNFGIEHLSGAYGDLNPLSSAYSVIFARIPDELIDSEEPIIFNIGFLENFQTANKTNIEDCPFRYSVTLVRSGDGSLAVGGFPADAAEELSAEQESDLVMTEVFVDDTITLDFVEMTINEVGIEEDIRITISTKSGSFTNTQTTGPQPEAGNKFVYIRGTIKNLHTSALSPDRGIFGNVNFDNYVYPVSKGQANISINNEEGRRQSSIEPLMTYTFTLYAAIPDELAENFSKGSFTFVFDDMFDSTVLQKEYQSGDPIAAAKHRYILTFK